MRRCLPLGLSELLPEPEFRRNRAMVGMGIDSGRFAKRSFHQHLIGAAACHQMVDECGGNEGHSGTERLRSAG